MPTVKAKQELVPLRYTMIVLGLLFAPLMILLPLRMKTPFDSICGWIWIFSSLIWIPPFLAYRRRSLLRLPQTCLVMLVFPGILCSVVTSGGLAVATVSGLISGDETICTSGLLDNGETRLDCKTDLSWIGDSIPYSVYYETIEQGPDWLPFNFVVSSGIINNTCEIYKKPPFCPEN